MITEILLDVSAAESPPDILVLPLLVEFLFVRNVEMVLSKIISNAIMETKLVAKIVGLTSDINAI